MRYEFVFRMKLKQAEVDCELLKRYNEELVEENRKLRIELVQISTQGDSLWKGFGSQGFPSFPTMSAPVINVWAVEGRL